MKHLFLKHRFTFTSTFPLPSLCCYFSFSLQFHPVCTAFTLKFSPYLLSPCLSHSLSVLPKFSSHLSLSLNVSSALFQLVFMLKCQAIVLLCGKILFTVLICKWKLSKHIGLLRHTCLHHQTRNQSHNQQVEHQVHQTALILRLNSLRQKQNIQIAGLKAKTIRWKILKCSVELKGTLWVHHCEQLLSFYTIISRIVDVEIL